MEGTSAITGPKCNKGAICNCILNPSIIKILSVITFGPKCNKGRICKSYLHTQTANELWAIRGKKCIKSPDLQKPIPTI